MNFEQFEGYSPKNPLENRQNLTDAQLVSALTSDLRIARGQLASYRLRELNRKGLAKLLATLLWWVEATPSQRKTARLIKRGVL